MCLSLKESLFVFTSKNVYKFIAQMSILNKKEKKLCVVWKMVGDLFHGSILHWGILVYITFFL